MIKIKPVNNNGKVDYQFKACFSGEITGEFIDDVGIETAAISVLSLSELKSDFINAYNSLVKEDKI